MIRVCDNGHAPARVQSGARCRACDARREAGRATRQARGYDRAHETARQSLIAMLPARCGYGCGTLLALPSEMVAAHVVDGDPDAGWMASCVRCNERAKHGTTPHAGRETRGVGLPVPASRRQTARMTLAALGDLG